MATPEQIAIIRARLLGLPSEITDDIITTTIDSSRTLHDAAIALAESAATVTISTAENIQIGRLRIGGNRTAANWQAIKDNLIRQKRTNSGIIVDPSNNVSNGYGATIFGGDIPLRTREGQFEYHAEDDCNDY